MTGPEKENLEKLLSTHLNERLGGQTGRAKAAFAEIARQENAAAARRRRAIYLWAGVPSALAACVAVAFGVLMMHGAGEMAPARNSAVAANVSNQPAAVPEMDQLTLMRTLDGGTAVLSDQTPVQILRHQELRQTEWVDPTDRATYRVEQPVEKVDYVQIQPY